MKGGGFTTLSNHLLIAMPQLSDPNFSQTVSLICEHGEKGALGIVLNRPLSMTLSEVFEQMKIEPTDKRAADLPVLRGGPVHQDRGFVLHKPLGEWQSTLAVSSEIGLTTSKDILEAVARGEGPKQILVTLGYAGWAPGQLEHELSQNAWLTVQAKSEVIFDLPSEERLPAAMSLLGVDYARLSEQAGHA